MPKLKMFDLCAGIGGFTYALSPIATTVAYAERDTNNQAILKRLATRGVLPTAPIYDDVNTLKTRVAGVAKPDIIAAGFPCQDLSASGNRVGLYGPKSSLFFTVCDVVKAWDPDFVLFENVPAVVDYIGTITRRMKALGYTCTWDLFSAAELGAPHIRKRWYCVCRKASAKPIPISPAMTQDLNAWTKTPPPSMRCVSGSCTGCQARRFALGNSIVPQCLRHAFVVLHARSFKLSPPAIPKFPRWSGKILIVPPTKESADSQLRTPALTKPLTLLNYHTPRASCWYPPKNLSKRGLGSLASQLAFQHDTPKMVKPRANPRFVEWVMGYPKDYTALPCRVHGVK